MLWMGFANVVELELKLEEVPLTTVAHKLFNSWVGQVGLARHGPARSLDLARSQR